MLGLEGEIQSKQIDDLPQIVMNVTEYRTQVVVCPDCNEVHTSEFLVKVSRFAQYGENLQALRYTILNVPEEKAYESLEELLNNLIVRKNLNEYGMKEEKIEIFSQGVIETQGRLLQNNYVEMTLDDIKKIYRELGTFK